MAKTPTTLGDIFDDYETERLAQIEKEQAEFDKPENVAKRKAKADAEHERGVRNGWWDADGNPLRDEFEDDEGNLIDDEDEGESE